uniref:Uncharacterized protein n=1 Tax=Anguilla anguilla TaxID=7936 RepID=A0A0E9XR64_ANGAN
MQCFARHMLCTLAELTHAHAHTHNELITHQTGHTCGTVLKAVKCDFIFKFHHFVFVVCGPMF